MSLGQRFLLFALSVALAVATGCGSRTVEIPTNPDPPPAGLSVGGTDSSAEAPASE